MHLDPSENVEGWWVLLNFTRKSRVISRFRLALVWLCYFLNFSFYLLPIFLIVSLVTNHSNSKIISFFVFNELDVSGKNVLSKKAKRKKHSKQPDVRKTAKHIQKVQDIINYDTSKLMRAIANKWKSLSDIWYTRSPNFIHEERVIHIWQNQGELWFDWRCCWTSSSILRSLANFSFSLIKRTFVRIKKLTGEIVSPVNFLILVAQAPIKYLEWCTSNCCHWWWSRGHMQ